MSEPYWFNQTEALALHQMMIREYGGTFGIRDGNMLESALARPQQRFHYSGEATMSELAAAYAVGVIKNHPFVDGNKRTGFMLAAGFLERNGHAFSAPEAEAVIQTLALAAGELDEQGYASWLQQHCKDQS